MNLKESIKIHEGFRSSVYLCPTGHPTVGYGFRVADLSADELALNAGAVEPMSKEVAEKILDIKITKFKKQVYNALPWLTYAPMDIQDALCEMAYQMGVAGLLGFKNTLAMIKERRYSEAAENMLKSKWATQTPKRAKQIANLVRNAG
ncbi:MAG: glycoside hydrolase family protein [Campylobacter sp.]|uniref:glycoside hydrolase family protein n=1 Tax=Campylobacter sp. TaxID=205 RepID=UPI002AA77286|nr:glycoside hydrolase family protein [Campylobacter sp.]MCI6343237.1 glycoside hydrolase family protein [Campylobacter sp.]